MQEFSSISVSTYEADGLVGQLNDKATDGWAVVAIVPTGSTVTAYLSRDRSDETPGAMTSEPSSETSSEAGFESVDEPSDDSTFASTAAVGAIGADALVPEPAPEPAAEYVAEPAAEPAAASGFPPVATAEPAPEPAPEPAAQAAATSAAPAGWYADPSGRFELRYWDGATWTEHVSRAGQQYTDPPVA
jgi:hypothetical protein